MVFEVKVGDVFRWTKDNDIMTIVAINNNIIRSRWLSNMCYFGYTKEEILRSIELKILIKCSKLEIAIMELQSSEKYETSNLK